MPTLPTYDAKRNFDANTAGPLMSGTPATLTATQHLGKVVTDIAQQWSDAHDVIQYTTGKSKYSVAQADIESRAAADPDFKNSAKYKAEIEAAKKMALDGIDNKMVAQKLALDVSGESQLAAIKIDSQFRQKEIKVGQTAFKFNLDALMQKKLQMGDGFPAVPWKDKPAEMQHYDDEMADLISSNVKAGIISTEEARKAVADAAQTSIRYEIYADGSTREEDSQILKDLKDPKGRFSGLLPDDRLKLLEESQHRIFQNNQTFKREEEAIKSERTDNLYQKINEGTATLHDMDQEMAAAEAEAPGALKQKEIKDIREGMLRRVKTDLEVITENSDEAKKYVEFVNSYVNDEGDRQKAREDIAAAYKDGRLSPQEARYLNKIYKIADDIKFNADRQAFMENNFVPFKNAVNAVTDFFRGKQHYNDQDAAMAIKVLVNGMSNGKKPEEVIPSIIFSDMVKDRPEIKNLPENGQVFLDPVTGVKMRVFPHKAPEAVK